LITSRFAERRSGKLLDRRDGAALASCEPMREWGSGKRLAMLAMLAMLGVACANQNPSTPGSTDAAATGFGGAAGMGGATGFGGAAGMGSGGHASGGDAVPPDAAGGSGGTTVVASGTGGSAAGQDAPPVDTASPPSTTPQCPASCGAVTGTKWSASQPVVAGNRLFTYDSNGALAIVDVSSTSTLSLLGRSTSRDYPIVVATQNNLLLTLTTSAPAQLAAIDISNPASPRTLRQVSLSSGAELLWRFTGTRVEGFDWDLTDRTHTFWAVDASDLSAPALTSQFAVEGDPTFAGRWALLAKSEVSPTSIANSLSSFDPDTARGTADVFSVSTAPLLSGLTAEGDVLYGIGGDRVFAYQAAAGQSPTLLGQSPSLGTCTDHVTSFRTLGTAGLAFIARDVSTERDRTQKMCDGVQNSYPTRIIGIDLSLPSSLASASEQSLPMPAELGSSMGEQVVLAGTPSGKSTSQLASVSATSAATLAVSSAVDLGLRATSLRVFSDLGLAIVAGSTGGMVGTTSAIRLVDIGSAGVLARGTFSIDGFRDAVSVGERLLVITSSAVAWVDIRDRDNPKVSASLNL
jgi:LVIVD repeat